MVFPHLQEWTDHLGFQDLLASGCTGVPRVCPTAHIQKLKYLFPFGQPSVGTKLHTWFCLSFTFSFKHVACAEYCWQVLNFLLQYVSHLTVFTLCNFKHAHGPGWILLGLFQPRFLHTSVYSSNDTLDSVQYILK